MTIDTSSPESPLGVWITYYADRSGANVFESELAALRFAVDKSMSVHFVEWGADVHTGVVG